MQILPASRASTRRPGVHSPPTRDPQRLQADFFARLGGPLQLATLFEDMPDVCFFVKNTDGYFVSCNQATLMALGLRDASQMLGKTDYDLAPAHVAEIYRQGDRQVVASALPLRGRVEAVPDAAGRLAWYVTSKAPVCAQDGAVVGIAVTLRSSATAGLALRPFEELSAALEHIFGNYGSPIPVEELAACVHLSVRQFERRFKRLFSVSPAAFVNQHRVRIAASLLRESDATIAEIAHRVGFYDHSHFIRLFRRTLGVTPSQYRAAWTQSLCSQASPPTV